MKYDLKRISQYLRLVELPLINKKLAALVFLVDLFGIIFAVCDPFLKIAFYTIIGFLIVVNIWAICIVYINNENKQIIFLLYNGIHSLISSFILFITFYKEIYLTLRPQSGEMLIIAGILYIAIILISFTFLKKLLKEGYYDKSKKKYINSQTVLVLSTSILGLLIGKFIVNQTSGNGTIIIGAVCVLVISFALCVYSIYNLYKFYIIKEYNLTPNDINNLLNYYENKK